MNPVVSLEVPFLIEALPTTSKIAFKRLDALVGPEMDFKSTYSVVLLATAINFAFKGFVASVVGHMGLEVAEGDEGFVAAFKGAFKRAFSGLIKVEAYVDTVVGDQVTFFSEFTVAAGVGAAVQRFDFLYLED